MRSQEAVAAARADRPGDTRPVPADLVDHLRLRLRSAPLARRGPLAGGAHRARQGCPRGEGRRGHPETRRAADALDPRRAPSQRPPDEPRPRPNASCRARRIAPCRRPRRSVAAPRTSSCGSSKSRAAASSRSTSATPPASGKTYQMLEDAHLLKKQGVDVVVGLVETHGRAETAERVGDLEVIPRRAARLQGQDARGDGPAGDPAPQARGRDRRRARPHQRARHRKRQALPGRRGSPRRRASR